MSMDVLEQQQRHLANLLEAIQRCANLLDIHPSTDDFTSEFERIFA